MDIIELTEKAKKAYNDSTANHPTIHCNRFPSWNELTIEHQNEWIAKIKRESITSANCIAG